MSGFIGTKLTMNLGERRYDIILKNGALENLYQFARLDRRVAVVTDAGVPTEYAQRVADQCRDAKIITVPQGEASKSMKILESVLRQMLEFNMGRGDLVIAVGGGVVGDLAGFAASIYMRGIDFINCPTTTLSMIDSSIGGKTAVDLGETKNIVGSFWQPKLVIVAPSTRTPGGWQVTFYHTDRITGDMDPSYHTDCDTLEKVAAEIPHSFCAADAVA